MPEITPTELTKLTRHAKERAEQEAQEQEAARLERLRAAELEQQTRADKVIRTMGSKCRNAARNGKNFAHIMNLKFGVDYVEGRSSAAGGNPENIRESDDDNQLRKMLVGAANLVHLACLELGFGVKTTSWHDGVGMDGGWKLTVVWPQ